MKDAFVQSLFAARLHKESRDATMEMEKGGSALGQQSEDADDAYIHTWLGNVLMIGKTPLMPRGDSNQT